MALSTPGISVNNVPISIVPNSFTFKLGKGEINVRAASTGGGATEPVHTENAETKIGMMKWEMYVTTENKQLISSWKDGIGSNFVSAQQAGDAPISMGSASMVNDPDFEASADGTVEVEFQGAQISDT